MISIFLTASLFFVPGQTYEENFESLTAEVLRHRLRINEMILKADFTAMEISNMNQRIFSIETQLNNLQKIITPATPNDLLLQNIQEEIRQLKSSDFFSKKKENEIKKLNDQLGELKRKNNKGSVQQLLSAVNEDTNIRSLLVLSFKDSKFYSLENSLKNDLTLGFQNSNIKQKYGNEAQFKEDFFPNKQIDCEFLCKKHSVDAIIFLSFDESEVTWLLYSRNPQNSKEVLSNNTRRFLRR